MTKLATVHRLRARKLPELERREIAPRTVVLCIVCEKPIEPRNESEWQTMEALQTHEGPCWQRLKRT
jgi:hypothetical protein